MEISAQDQLFANELKLKNLMERVGEYLVQMNYAGIMFVHHPEQKHIGVEIIPMPKKFELVKP